MSLDQIFNVFLVPKHCNYTISVSRFFLVILIHFVLSSLSPNLHWCNFIIDVASNYNW